VAQALLKSIVDYMNTPEFAPNQKQFKRDSNKRDMERKGLCEEQKMVMFFIRGQYDV
jgi:hypothetical protein